MMKDSNVGDLRRSSLFVYVAIWSIASSIAVAQTGQGQLDSTQLSQQSTFVFKGTVQKIKASTMSQVPASDTTAIVSVDSVQRCTTNLCGLAKSSVTVALSAPESVKEGEQATFFTQGWLLGAGVAVKELKHVTPPLADAEVTSILAEGSRTLTNQALRNQLSAASCVVSGQVEAVTPLKNLSPRPTEHDPKWQDAKIKVVTIEKKGCLSNGATTVDVVFPASKDIVWVNSPRFQEGQQGVWILNPIPGGRFKTFAAPSANTYTSLRNDDFKGLDKLETIRSILKVTEGK
jgi:hypothetical protein